MDDNNEGYSKRHLKRIKQQETEKILQKIQRVTAEYQKTWNENDEKMKFNNNKMDFSKTQMPLTPTPGIHCGCGPALKRIEQSLIELTQKVENLQAENYCQIEVVVDTLAEQTTLLKNINRKGIAKPPLCKRFPVPTVADLVILEKDINSINREQYLESISSLIRTGGVQKNLKNVLSDEVIMQSNVNGDARKSRLKDHTQFFDILIDAICSDMGCEADEALNQLRKALQLHKNRCFKKGTALSYSSNKPSSTEICNDPLD